MENRSPRVCPSLSSANPPQVNARQTFPHALAISTARPHMSAPWPHSVISLSEPPPAVYEAFLLWRQPPPVPCNFPHASAETSKTDSC
jgi:hypothetical protein